MSYDELARFTQERFGTPTACHGTVTDEFDGAKFGILLLSFPGGISLEVVTMPSESSLTTLRAESGFSDEAEVRQAIQSYAEGIGLELDWSRPEVTAEVGHLVHRFWDPETGLNAAASLIFSEGRLVAVRVSMAL
jgi:hypothetical protein